MSGSALALSHGEDQAIRARVLRQIGSKLDHRLLDTVDILLQHPLVKRCEVGHIEADPGCPGRVIAWSWFEGRSTTGMKRKPGAFGGKLRTFR